MDRVEAVVCRTAQYDRTRRVGDAVHIHVNAQALRAAVSRIVDCGARAALAAVGAAVGLGVGGDEDAGIDFFDEGRAIEAAGLAVAGPLMGRSVVVDAVVQRGAIGATGARLSTQADVLGLRRIVGRAGHEDLVAGPAGTNRPVPAEAEAPRLGVLFSHVGHDHLVPQGRDVVVALVGGIPEGRKQAVIVHGVGLEADTQLAQVRPETATRASSRASCSAGSSRAISKAMMAITTNNSIRVKPIRHDNGLDGYPMVFLHTAYNFTCTDHRLEAPPPTFR